MTRLSVIVEAAGALLERRAAPDGTEVTRKDGRTYKKVGAKWVYQRRGKGAAKPAEDPKPPEPTPAPAPPPAAKKPRAKAEPGGTITAAQAEKMFLKLQGNRPTAKENLAKVKRDLKFLLGESHGLHTLLNAFSATEAGVFPQIHSVDTSFHKIHVRLTLHDKKGNQIGYTVRQLNRDEDGNLNAHQSDLFLTDGVKDSTGAGLGPKIIKNNFDAYEKMGIKKATVDASYVGSYVWAKMGYSATPAEMKKLNEGFKQHLAEKGIQHPGDFTTAREIADFAAGNVKHGKEFLLKVGEGGNGWRGEVNIDQNDPGYQVMRQYLEKSR